MRGAGTHHSGNLERGEVGMGGSLMDPPWRRQAWWFLKQEGLELVK